MNIDNASIPFSPYNTDYNIGINEPIKVRDGISRNSSKIIIFLSDGEHNAPESPHFLISSQAQLWIMQKARATESILSV